MGTRRVRKPTGPRDDCGKQPLATRRLAERARKRMLRRDRRSNDGFRTEVFYCDVCRAWHLGRWWRAKR